MRPFPRFPNISVLLCGFAALILIGCKEPAKLPPSTAGQSSASAKKFSSYNNWAFGAQAYKHTKQIVSFGPRPIESAGHRKTQNYIADSLRNHGWTVKPQQFEVGTPYGKRKFTNYIARYSAAGTKAKSPDILLAAHYDSKLLDGFLGADDAASCVGALLEIAEFLPKEDPARASRVELIFFDGEEALKKDIVPSQDGLYGSLYYSSYLNKDVTSVKKNYNHRPKFGILLDMVGHRNLSIKIPSDTPYKLMKDYNRLARKHGLQDRFGVAPGPIIDDHLFVNEIAKVPMIDLIGDFSNPTNKWWHTKHDNMSLISEKSLAISIQFALELMKEYDSNL